MSMHLNRTRAILVAVHIMVFVTVLALFIGAGSFGRSNPVFLMLYLLLPLMVVAWSVVDIEPKARILGYWGLAVLMVPLAGLGIFGGYGLLYLIGIIFLLWAALMENEE